MSSGDYQLGITPLKVEIVRKKLIAIERSESILYYNVQLSQYYFKIKACNN